jgi:hypothetical protein
VAAPPVEDYASIGPAAELAGPKHGGAVMPHRLIPRRHSRVPELLAILAAVAAALFLVLYGPPARGIEQLVAATAGLAGV